VNAAARLRAAVARAKEIGLDGVLRRVEYRVGRPARDRVRAAWRARYVDRPALPNGLSALALGPFFFAATDAARDAFRARHARGLDALVAQAEAVLAGDLAWVAPGARPDWHAAIPNAARWPLAPNDEIAIGAARPLGDVRLAWEVGRFVHVVRLAQAAWLTRDTRFAKAAAAAIDGFVAENPPGRGIAWAHAQEVAIRAVAWLWAIALARDVAGFETRAGDALAWHLAAHGDYVAAHLADHPSTHNHLISEAAGLAVLGIALPALPQAAGWRDRGLRLLWRELAKQVWPDGVHAEHSTHYHAFVLDSFVAVLLLCDRAGLAVPAAARERIAAMTDALAWWMHGDGTLPAIGDTDAGRAWRLGTEPLDRRDLLAAAAIAFDRSDWGAIAGDAPGAFWLGSGRAVPSAAGVPPAGGLRRFEPAGLAVARTGFDAAAEVFVFRAGPTRFRPDVLRSHLHADALGVLWRIGTDDLLIDPGTYLYSEAEGWRAALRGTASHSCVVLDGRDQADVTSARFGIAGERAARWLGCDGGATGMTACAEHPAAGEPRVRRRIAWRSARFLALCDDVLGARTHRIESWLQLPAADVLDAGDGVVLRLASGRTLRVQAFAGTIAVRQPRAGDPPGPGWRAPRYGAVESATALRIDAGPRALPFRSIVLVQTAAADVPPPAEATADAIRGAGYAVRFEGECGVRIEERS
jgi:hypothetical protein